MTSDSSESFRKHIEEVHRTHQRATKAMLSRIVLRPDSGHTLFNNLLPDVIENDIRAAIWSSEHELAQLDPEHLLRPDTPLSLAETIATSHIEELAVPGRPLTKDRLFHVDPGLVKVAEELEGTDIGWPDDERVFHDVLPEDYDDIAFAHRLAEGSKAYNNFPALLSTPPSLPELDEAFIDFMHRTKLFQYATKPYLARAYALQPDFMNALQRSMTDVGSPQAWRERLLDATAGEDADHEDMVLLRASRLAYQLLINLMGKDDLMIQSKILTMSSQREIQDPVVELWT